MRTYVKGAFVIEVMLFLVGILLSSDMRIARGPCEGYLTGLYHGAIRMGTCHEGHVRSVGALCDGLMTGSCVSRGPPATKATRCAHEGRVRIFLQWFMGG